MLRPTHTSGRNEAESTPSSHAPCPAEPSPSSSHRAAHPHSPSALCPANTTTSHTVPPGRSLCHSVIPHGCSCPDPIRSSVPNQSCLTSPPSRGCESYLLQLIPTSLPHADFLPGALRAVPPTLVGLRPPDHPERSCTRAFMGQRTGNITASLSRSADVGIAAEGVPGISRDAQASTASVGALRQQWVGAGHGGNREGGRHHHRCGRAGTDD